MCNLPFNLSEQPKLSLLSTFYLLISIKATMKNHLTFLLLGCIAALSAQNLPNYKFDEFENIPCPFDSTVNIGTYKHWLIYQTLDDTWNGPVDSSQCISLSSTPAEGILLTGTDLDRPFFVRAKFTDNTKILLQKNMLYTAFAYEHFSYNEVELEYGLDCPGNLCSGLIVGIEVPDSTGTATAMRWYTDVPDTTTNAVYFETCVPTEYFENNYLREYIIKIKVAPGTEPDQKIRLYRAIFNDYNGTNYLREVIAPANSFADTSFRVYIHEIGEITNPWNGENYLMLYSDVPQWPSSAHPSFVEGRPEINTPDPQTIDLLLYSGQILVPQPFTFLRGALVEGSDSVRHRVNLINDGGDICLGGPIDFVVGGGTGYIHHDGHLDFRNRSACMMFENGGSLEVAQNAHLQYGYGGIGILALRPGSTIHLAKGSSLLIDNLLWLQGMPTARFPDHQIYMELNPGSTLVFGDHASIINNLSQYPDTRLNIYMNGGTLDDSRLSQASRNLINRIYPTPQTTFAENIKVLQNPTDRMIRLEYVAADNHLVSSVLFDLNGRKIGERQFMVDLGLNYIQYDMEDLPAGVYILQVKTHLGNVALKLAKATN